MSRRTGPGTRIDNQTPISTLSRGGKNRLKTIRKPATTTKDTHTIAGEMDFAIFRNDGNNKIKLQFKTDASSNWWTILPGEKTPVIGVAKDVDVHFASVGGNSTIEFILWA